jgi:hypothetical protein
LSQFLFEGTCALFAIDQLFYKELQPLTTWNIILIDFLAWQQRLSVGSGSLLLRIFLHLLKDIIDFDV